MAHSRLEPYAYAYSYTAYAAYCLLAYATAYDMTAYAVSVSVYMPC